MAAPVVVIVFHSTSGTTETLAMSAAVGAVQGRALIRLRRVPEASAADAVADRSEHREALTRMRKEYVAPTEADILGADGLILVPPPGAMPTSPEWHPFITLLEQLGGDRKLAGKVGALVHTGDANTQLAFSMALLAPGLVHPPPTGPVTETERPRAAVEQGRRVADLVKSLKAAT